MDKCIKIKDLNFFYEEGTNVLKDLNLEISKGEFVGIIGNSGSGKSTLVKHFNGILKCDSGEVEVLNVKLDKKSTNLKELRKKVGLVFQFPDEQLFSESIEEDIIFSPKKFKLSQEEILLKLEKVKKNFNIDKELLKMNYRTLSGGEKRRVAIASVGIMEPEILILDEPTIGLDFQSKLNLMKILKELNMNGTTIIIITHDLETIWGSVNKIVYMKDGRIEFSGGKSKFLQEIERFEEKDKILPNYIELLYHNNLLKGNEDKVSNREDVFKILKESFKNEVGDE